MAAKNNNPASKWLNSYFGKDHYKPKAAPESKLTIRNDKYDTADYDHILNEMKELSVAEDKLSTAVSTGSSAMADEYFSLVKANPQLKPEEAIRPSYLVNRHVMDEAMKLKEWEQLRSNSTSDTVVSALACIAMEPELEILFDKLKEEQKLADKLQEQMEQMQGMADDLRSAEDMEADAMAEGDGEGQADYQDQQEKIKAAMDKLREAMEKNAKQLDDQIQGKAKPIKDSIKKSLNDGKDKAEEFDGLSSTWGLDPGELLALPAQRRIELASKFNNERFRRIAQLLGPMARVALAEQQKKVTSARNEIYDLELGNDIGNVIPTELMYLIDDDAAMLFFQKFMEQNLLQYKLRGTEKVAKGGIIYCEDGSGSMSGDPELWSKAVGLSLYRVAQMQKREFYGIHFGSPGELATFDFHKEISQGVDIKLHGNPYRATASDTGHYENIDGVIKFAEFFFSGGTCFTTPLTEALRVLQEQHASYGAVKADIVFCTDGMCGVDEKWLLEFQKEKERLGFKVWAILVGYGVGNKNMEPLASIADGRVVTLKELLHDSPRSIFAGI